MNTKEKRPEGRSTSDALTLQDRSDTSYYNRATREAADSYYEHAIIYGHGLDDIDDLDPETIARNLMAYPAVLRGCTPAPSTLTPEQIAFLTPYVEAGIRTVQRDRLNRRAELHRMFHATVQASLNDPPYWELEQARGNPQRAQAAHQTATKRGLTR